MPRNPPQSPTDTPTALEWLKSHSSQSVLDGMARYAIPSDRAWGVPVRDIKALGKLLGRKHDLAIDLWKTEVYEARMLVSFVADPALLTPAQMDRWCRDFDNWAICDTMCFHLFDRSPHAWKMVPRWSASPHQWVKRTAFALIWSLSVHDKVAGNQPFLDALILIEKAAGDNRNFVMKSVSMALRATGKRNSELRAAAIDLAHRLAASTCPASRWVGKHALRDLM